MIYMKKLEIRLDNKLMYKKLKEAEIEMKNSTKRYTIDELKESVNKIIK